MSTSDALPVTFKPVLVARTVAISVMLVAFSTLVVVGSVVWPAVPDRVRFFVLLVVLEVVLAAVAFLRWVPLSRGAARSARTRGAPAPVIFSNAVVRRHDGGEFAVGAGWLVLEDAGVTIWQAQSIVQTGAGNLVGSVPRGRAVQVSIRVVASGWGCDQVEITGSGGDECVFEPISQRGLSIWWPSPGRLAALTKELGEFLYGSSGW